VIQGMRTLELRMIPKCIGTIVLARALAHHPEIQVSCNAVPDNENSALRERHSFLGLPAPLFTLRFATGDDAEVLDRGTFKRFFDCLEPSFGLQVSLGQLGTVVLCPALTSHSELSEQSLRAAGISPTTIRVSVGDEDPRTLLAHFMRAAELAIDPVLPGFSQRFMAPDAVDDLYREVYLDVHARWFDSRASLSALLA
jgi:O-acetylhomoserine (thiol)-lyase